jgi:lipoprotein-anchoring transpeptidase ErfK/SrfK
MRSRWLYRLAHASPIAQGLAIVGVLLLVLAVFEVDAFFFGGAKPAHTVRHVAVASPSPSPEPSPSAPPTPTATASAVPIPVSSTVAVAQGAFLKAYASPSTRSRVVGTVDPHNLIGQQTPMLVVGSAPGWYQVLLPVMLPNDTAGWVEGSGVQTQTVNDFILANLSTFTLEHYVSGKLVNSYPIAEGASATPTPTGMFYVWAIQQSPGPPYNPVIFALSALSPTLRNWPDGGIVGIHGWADTSVEGKAVSNGCMRMKPSDAQALLSSKLPLGTPVEVVT